MKRLLLLLAALIIAPSAEASTLFDIAAYCRQVAAVAGGSYQIEETCRQQETAALYGLRNKGIYGSEPIPARVVDYCTQVGRIAGGSYQIMLTCVEQELAARDRMRGRTR